MHLLCSPSTFTQSYFIKLFHLALSRLLERMAILPVWRLARFSFFHSFLNPAILWSCLTRNATVPIFPGEEFGCLAFVLHVPRFQSVMTLEALVSASPLILGCLLLLASVVARPYSWRASFHLAWKVGSSSC